MLAFLSGIQMIRYRPAVSPGYDEHPDGGRLTRVLYAHLTQAVSAVWLEFTLKPPSAPQAPFQLVGLPPQPGSLLSSLLPSSNLAFSISFLSCVHPFLICLHPLTLSVSFGSSPVCSVHSLLLKECPVCCLHLPHLVPLLHYILVIPVS